MNRCRTRQRLKAITINFNISEPEGQPNYGNAYHQPEDPNYTPKGLGRGQTKIDRPGLVT